MIGVGWIARAGAAFWLVAVGLSVPADAELVLSDLVVELQAGKNSRKDIELWNNSDGRSYVEISPAEIVNPGKANESRRQALDPEQLGLLVSPNRMILEPGQHKVIRVAAIAAPGDRDRVYRITVKPVVGDVSGEHTGLKLLIGYDVLTIVRPANPNPKIVGLRDGRTALIRNEGNASAELINGKQCNSAGGQCVVLPGKRLYAGAEWRLPLEGEGLVEFSVKVSDRVSTIRF